MGELWNLVDSKGIATGIKYECGASNPIPDGLYHLAVFMIMIGSKRHI